MLTVITVVTVLAGPSSALTASDIDAIAADLSAEGRYLELAPPEGTDAAIDRANDAGIAFAWVDVDDDGEAIARDLSGVLGSRFETVVVLTRSTIGAWSPVVTDADVEAALDASGTLFGRGELPAALDAFTASVTGQATTATTTSPADTPIDNGDATPSGSSGGGIGLGRILLIAAIAGGGFLLFRRARAGSRAKKEAAIELEADRAEIKEQLRNNADHVLELGDRAIASGRSDLVELYEKASAAYQEVSGAIDSVQSPDEVDRLDDMIDEAEWQFESIEAQLEGRPVPPSPSEIEARAREALDERDAGDRAQPGQRDQPAPSGRPTADRDRPALAPDESVFDGQRRQGRMPAPPRSPIPAPRRRRRGGGLGGALGGVLGSIVLGGGGLGGGFGTSRRSQRRRTGRSPSSGPFGGSTRAGGTLGGGVLRRGGQRRGGGGRRSIGRSGGGGSRRL